MIDHLELPPGAEPRLVQGGWTIESAGRTGVLALNSGHYFADGEGVSILLRMFGEDVTVSDGGVARRRLEDAQVDLSGETVRRAWAATLKDFGLTERDERIVGRKPVAELHSLLTDMVDALLTLDGLKVMARRPRPDGLDSQLYAFLQKDLPFGYDQRPTVTMEHGLTFRPTALVHAPHREVYVQTAGTAERFEHATVVVQKLIRADEHAGRLVVLKGLRDDWAQDLIDLLGGTSVGFMGNRPELRELLHAD